MSVAVLKLFIIDEYGDTESAATVTTPKEAIAWFAERGHSMEDMIWSEQNDAFIVQRRKS